MTDYEKIQSAITYIHHNFKAQPSLFEVASHVYVSPYHFQRLFEKWAGVSPKKFLQYTTHDYAKTLLDQNKSLASTAEESGLSGSGRLHDLFVNLEAMTPGEYKNQGEGLEIVCSQHESLFGLLNIASTTKGICHVSFNDEAPEEEMKQTYGRAIVVRSQKDTHQDVVECIKHLSTPDSIQLHLKGTSFQLRIWRALLSIPFGEMRTYGQVAESIGMPSASRAVGSAIGKNPIAYLIPCHRVINATGKSGGYRWGAERKVCMNGWEAARVNILQRGI